MKLVSFLAGATATKRQNGGAKKRERDKERERKKEREKSHVLIFYVPRKLSACLHGTRERERERERG